MKLLKITQISADLNPSLGGPVEVINALSPYFDNHYDFNQIVVGSYFGKYTTVGIRSFMNNRYGFTISYKLIKSLRILKDSDIVICHGFYLPTTLLTFFLRGKSILIMPHGSLEQYQWHKSRFEKKIFDSLYSWSSKFNRIEFIVATESEKNSILKYFGETPVTVVGLGVDIPEIRHQRIENKETQIRLLCFSRIAKKKRLDNCILALDILNQNHGDYILDIAGGGDLELTKKLKTIASDIEYADDVHFLGWIDKKDLNEIFSRAAIFLLPSENENFAVAVAQAIVRGVPVLISENVALSYFVKKYNCGVVIDDISPQSIAQAIQKINEELAMLSENCLLHGSKLYWENVIHDWYSVLERK